MGKKAAEALDIDYEGLVEYLHCNHSVYMKIGSSVYYLTDCNYESWRAQDTSRTTSSTAPSSSPRLTSSSRSPSSTARPSRTSSTTPRSTPRSRARRTRRSKLARTCCGAGSHLGAGPAFMRLGRTSRYRARRQHAKSRVSGFLRFCVRHGLPKPTKPRTTVRQHPVRTKSSDPASFSARKVGACW